MLKSSVQFCNGHLREIPGISSPDPRKRHGSLLVPSGPRGWNTRMPFRSFIAALLLMLCPGIAAAADGPQPLKIVCWNIHHGEGTDGKLDLARIAAVIKAQEPDIVALQEVDRNCNRSGKVDQAAVLAELTGMKSAFGEAMPYDGGSYGQAILSKHPIESTRVIRLSERKEPRIALLAKILHPSGPLTVVGTHLDHKDAQGRLAEGGVLLSALEQTAGPVIVAGDFNDVPESALLALFKTPWTRVEGIPDSFPAAKPKKVIDHIFWKGFTGPVTGTMVDETVASDHRPITATFRFP